DVLLVDLGGRDPELVLDARAERLDDAALALQRFVLGQPQAEARHADDHAAGASASPRRRSPASITIPTPASVRTTPRIARGLGHRPGGRARGRPPPVTSWVAIRLTYVGWTRRSEAL